jgi:DNA-binding MarR family transcriptional regulator
MTTTTIVFEVTGEEFKKLNGAMIRLLLTLDECGDGSLPTRQLFESANMSSSWGSRIVTKAKAAGYIERVRVPKSLGQKGNNMMINKLTPKARTLLDRLGLT